MITEHKPVSQVYRIEVERKADGRRFIRDFHARDADKAIADYRAMLGEEVDDYSFVSAAPVEEGVVMAAPGTSNEFRRFHNSLRVLFNIDASEFPGPREEWPRFRDQPHRYFIECPDVVATALWGIIERRDLLSRSRAGDAVTALPDNWPRWAAR